MDTDVLQRVEAALLASPFNELRTLHVNPHEQGLLISGTVSCFYHKQLAQEIVLALCHDLAVHNTVRVVGDCTDEKPGRCCREQEGS